MSPADPVVGLCPWRAPAGEPFTCALGDYECDVLGAEVLATGELALMAEDTWLLSGPAHLLAKVHEALPAQSTLLPNDVLALDFGNSVGLIDVPGLGRWQLRSGKWDQSHFEWMLKDLMDIASALPFAASNPSALPYDRSVAAQDDVLYHAFVYLRDKLLHQNGGPDDLLTALKLVVQQPHQRLERHREDVHLERASWIEPAALVSIVTGHSPLLKARGSVAGLPLAVRLHGHVPERVRETRLQATYDTAENRFVKTVLRLAAGVADRMRDVARREPATSLFRGNVLRDCEAIEQTMLPIQRHPLWRDVGEMVHLPAGSTVLQQRRGYKDVFRHFARLRLAAKVPLTPATIRDLLEIRDIALLYELWCFFTVAQAVTELLGEPTSAEGPEPGEKELTVSRDLAIQWGGNASLYYNRSFSRSRPDRRSYSLPLRPDVALEVSDGNGSSKLHLFDAKFRLDKLDTFMPAAESEQELDSDEVEERRGTFKRADLYKMHTYRDAIPKARSVWILYPGTEPRFYGEASGTWSGLEANLPGLDGVGAIPLQPADHVQKWLRYILSEMLNMKQSMA